MTKKLKMYYFYSEKVSIIMNALHKYQINSE